MSKALRSKAGNLSKVKYFLPGYRQPLGQHNHHDNPQQSNQPTRKSSKPNAHTRSLQEQS